MTDLERAKFMAVRQIVDRWSQNLSFDEQQELYKHVISEMEERLKDDRQDRH